VYALEHCLLVLQYTPWIYPHNDPTSNGGVQGLIDLGATTAISDIWINGLHGPLEFVLEIFADSPFDDKPVWQQLVNTSHNSTKQPTHPPFVCTGWGWNQRWCGWNISATEAR
jgi:hypothetical protein